MTHVIDNGQNAIDVFFFFLSRFVRGQSARSTIPVFGLLKHDFLFVFPRMSLTLSELDNKNRMDKKFCNFQFSISYRTQVNDEKKGVTWMFPDTILHIHIHLLFMFYGYFTKHYPKSGFVWIPSALCLRWSCSLNEPLRENSHRHQPNPLLSFSANRWRIWRHHHHCSIFVPVDGEWNAVTSLARHVAIHQPNSLLILLFYCQKTLDYNTD